MKVPHTFEGQARSELAPDRMIVLDFSGTISLAASEYGRETLLLQKLKSSGLWQLGIDTAQRFWNELVNPTWPLGGTTSQGYVALLGERLRQLCAGREDRPQDSDIQACATAFVNDYFNASHIDPAWQPVLGGLAAQSLAIPLIATDHYAEATGHLLNQLHTLGIEAVPVSQPRRAGQILVANSADLGHWKAAAAFWQACKRMQAIDRLALIAVVDDFGFNEAASDDYARPASIARRQMQMTDALADVFSAQVRVFPFFAKTTGPVTDAERAEAYRKLIDRAGHFIQTMLTVDR